MADANRAVNGPLVEQFREPGYAPDALANLQAAMVEQAKSGGVITAILEPPESLQKQWRRIFLADISNDAAHGWLVC
jgi:hypothetical protein